MAVFYARFVPNFSKRAAPLHALKKRVINFYGQITSVRIPEAGLV
jgi:hypothetical protein